MKLLRSSCCLLSLAWLMPGAAAGDPAPVPSASARGRLLYRMHCQSCHGSEGRGDGPMATVLRLPPADLTDLTPEGEPFPTEAVARAIDGRREVPGHGSREMPVWGWTFQVRGKDIDQEVEVGRRIEALVAYLQSVQQRSPRAPPD